MSPPVLAYEVSDAGVATLTLARPDKRNALNSELIEAIASAMDRVREDAGARVVCLRGEGEDFCAGADLAELASVTEQGIEASRRDAARLGDLLLQVRRLPKPVVALIHGRALAGGAGLATACDLIWAREDAEMGYPEVYLGFVPAMVMPFLKQKVTAGRAFELVTSGRRVSAQEAAEMGLVQRVLPWEGFETLATSGLEDLATRAPSAMAMIKALFYELDDLGIEDGVARGAQVNAEARATEACRDGVRRFLERSGR